MIELLKYILFGAAFWVTPEPVNLYADVPCVINFDLSAINGGAEFLIDITHLIDTGVPAWKYAGSEQANVFREVDVFIDAYYEGGVIRFFYNGDFSYGNDNLKMSLRPDTAGRIQMVGKKINKIVVSSNKDLLGVRIRWSNGHL